MISDEILYTYVTTDLSCVLVQEYLVRKMEFGKFQMCMGHI
jgi:hypothetical protein